MRGLFGKFGWYTNKCVDCLVNKGGTTTVRGLFNKFKWYTSKCVECLVIKGGTLTSVWNVW